MIANRMRALRRNVLREFRQEVQQRENLEIPLGPGCDAASLMVRKGPTRLFLTNPSQRHQLANSIIYRDSRRLPS